jgi:hypothetical protein
VTVAHQTRPGRTDRTGGGPGWRFGEWLFGIVGGIALFLGLFIFFAGDDQYVGIGGDLSWRVGDISSAWAWSLLIGGVVLLVVALVMLVAGRNRPARVAMGDRRAELLWHAGIFLVVNAFIWIQDLAIGGGLEYAYWVTIPWGIGLGAHAIAYYTNSTRTQ